MEHRSSIPAGNCFDFFWWFSGRFPWESTRKWSEVTGKFPVTAFMFHWFSMFSYRNRLLLLDLG
jgi:hypothetical protein